MSLCMNSFEDDPLGGVLEEEGGSGLGSGISRLRRIAEQDDDDVNELIYGSDDNDSLYDSLPDNEPPSPGVEDLVPEEPPSLPMQDWMQQELNGNLGPEDDRPPIFDEDGQEMKIPEMTDEDFNASFGEYLARTGQGLHTTQRSAEAVAVAGESAGVGAAVAAGTSVCLGSRHFTPWTGFLTFSFLPSCYRSSSQSKGDSRC